MGESIEIKLSGNKYAEKRETEPCVKKFPAGREWRGTKVGCSNKEVVKLITNTGREDA